MKTKTDVYTKIVLTAIAIFLGIIVVKDISFVTKAQANELDLSEIKIEQRENNDRTVFYIYENSRLKRPASYSSGSVSGYIESSDIPQYVITNKTGSFYIR